MLDRETCEALAAAYLEVGERRFDEGDWVYWHDQDDCDSQPYALDNGFADEETWNDHGKKAIWCPRLDQLLDLARTAAANLTEETKRGGFYLSLDWHIGENNRFGGPPCLCTMRTTVPGWAWPAMATAMFGDTPEAAVAAWLLAVKEAHHAKPDHAPQ